MDIKQKIKIELSFSEIDTIAKCLQTAPMAWIETNPILMEINKQVMAITKPEINNSQNDKAKQEAICQQ